MTEPDVIGAVVTGLQSGGNAALIGLAVVAWRAGSALIQIGQLIGERLARIEKALADYMRESE